MGQFRDKDKEETMGQSKRFLSKLKYQKYKNIISKYYKNKKKRQNQKEKKEKSFRRPSSRIGLGDQIDYRNMSLMNKFISRQGKILSRQVNQLTLKQQRFVTLAIKQARILSLLPFLNIHNEKEFEERKRIQKLMKKMKKSTGKPLEKKPWWNNKKKPLEKKPLENRTGFIPKKTPTDFRTRNETNNR